MTVSLLLNLSACPFKFLSKFTLQRDQRAAVHNVTLML